MAWIRTVPVDEAKARLAPIYQAALNRTGRVFGILRLMSLQPAVLKASLGLYVHTTTTTDSPIPRWFRELVAVWVSRLNDCFY